MKRPNIENKNFFSLSDDSLKSIIMDAGEAAKAMQSINPNAENKYLDQMNDACTVLKYNQNRYFVKGE
jgi:hypothetical protein